MELKDFISNTIEQISLGIIDASKKCESHGVIVNPNITVGSNGDYSIPKSPEHVNIQRRVQIIDMDIAVNLTNTEGSELGGKIGVSFLRVGRNTIESKNTTHENRIKFSLPICLPTSEVLKGDK